MILPSEREWLATVADLPEADLPTNSSTVAYAVALAVKAVREADEALNLLAEARFDEALREFGGAA